MILLTGTIEHLQVGFDRASLLAGLSGSRAQNLADFESLVGSKPENAPKSRSPLNYDTDQLEYFACYIGEDLVQGMYPNVTFRAGDEVDVVVKRVGNKNHVQAIRTKTENLMWIPLMREKSIGATFVRSLREGLWLTFFFYVVLGIFAVSGAFDGDEPVAQLLTWSVPVMVTIFMGMWDFAAEFGTGMRSTRVFRMLSLPNPYWLNLAPYSLLNLDQDPYGECVYRYGTPSPVRSTDGLSEIIPPSPQAKATEE